MFTPTAIGSVIKIGLYRGTSIGDVVLATACIDFLRQIACPVQITWIGRRPALQLIASAFPEIRVVEADPDIVDYQSKVLRELRDIHFLIDLQSNLRSQLLCRALKKEFKIPSYSYRKNSFDRGAMIIASRLRGRRKSLPEDLRSSGKKQFEAMVDALRDALGKHLPVELADGLDKIKATPILPTIHDAGQKPWQKELKFGHWVAIAPGAAHETKRAPWTILRDAAEYLAKALIVDPRFQQSGVGLLFVGNEIDREVAVGILDSLAWSGPVLNLAGKLSLWETALALKESRVLLCNDSSLLHIAEAVGTPVAALFGPTVEAFGFPPWRESSRVFSSSLGCRPCSKHGQTNCRYGDKLCFSLIQVPPVAEYLKSCVIDPLKTMET